MDKEKNSLTISRLISGDETLKKPALTALIVGATLTAINHGDIILFGLTPDARKLTLNYCAPYRITTREPSLGNLFSSTESTYFANIFYLDKSQWT